MIGNLADPESFRAAADAQDGYVHAALDRSSGRGPAIEKIALETIIAAAKRPRTAGASAAETRSSSSRPGMWVLGQRARADRGRRAAQPDRDGVASPRARTAGARCRHAIACGRSSSGPASSTAAATAWSAISSRPRPTAWFASSATATITGRSSTIATSAISTRELAANDDASGVYHANDEGDERVNDIVAAISPYLPVRPDVRHVPIEEARTQDGPVRRRAGARSDRPQPAGPGARVDADAAFGRGERRAPAGRVAWAATGRRVGRSFLAIPPSLPFPPVILRRFQIVRIGPWQQIEKGIETSIERTAELRNRAVDRVQREACRRTIGQRQGCIAETCQRSFRHETYSVYERVASHDAILVAEVLVASHRCRILPRNRLSCRWCQEPFALTRSKTGE